MQSIHVSDESAQYKQLVNSLAIVHVCNTHSCVKHKNIKQTHTHAHTKQTQKVYSGIQNLLTAAGFVRTSFIYSATVIGPVRRILAFNCLHSSVSADFCVRDVVWNRHLDSEITKDP